MKFYLLGKNKRPKGPYSLSQLRELWKAGKIPETTLCCEKGGKKWLPITQFREITNNTTVGADTFSDWMFFVCLLLLPVTVWWCDKLGWGFWSFLGCALALFILEIIFFGKRKNPTIFAGLCMMFLAAGILYLPYTWIFGSSSEPLNDIYSYQFGSGSGVAIKFREDESATWVGLYKGSPLWRSQWTYKRRGSSITLRSKNPEKVKNPEREMTIQENGNLRYVEDDGDVEIYIKGGD